MGDIVRSGLTDGHQSVAHMPMKAMVYKTLSTVIDDLFA
jgi:hypothetical protein